MSRSNYLRQAISDARGQLTIAWHVPANHNIPKHPPLELDRDHLALGSRHRTIVDCFRHLDETYQRTELFLKDSELDYLHLNYERDLEEDATRGFNKSIDFLGLASIKPPISLQKLEERAVSDIVSNYSAIQSRLKNTPYEWMCDSD